MAERPKQLQNALDALHDFGTSHKLEINVSKTKIVIFSRGKIRKLPSFNLSGNDLEIVFGYTYLGTYFNYNGKLLSTNFSAEIYFIYWMSYSYLT